MASAKATIDHDEIRQWVEERGGHPAHVTRSGEDGDPGILRIDYPGFSGQGTLERISWDEFFDAFDSNNLAFLYQAEGNSRFSKLVGRSTVAATGGGAKRASSRNRPAARRASTSSRKRTASSKKRTSAKKASPSKRTSAKRSSASKKRATSSSKKRAASTSRKRSTSSKRRTSARTVRASSSAVTTTSHNEIKRWVEAHGGFPAHVKRTGSRKDPGVLRIDYPGYSGKQSLERISWNDWFNWFDRDKLAFLYQKTANSRFSKLVQR